LLAAAPKLAEDTRRKIALHRARERLTIPPSPARQGKLFELEQLKIDFHGSLELPEREVLLAALDWTPLVDADDREYQGLTQDEFRYDESARTYVFDLDGERMAYRLADRQLELTLLAASGQLDESGLAFWLEEKCRQPDIFQQDMLEFCRRSVHSLLHAGGFDLGLVNRAKHALCIALQGRLERSRRESAKRGFQLWLTAPNPPLQIHFEDPHRFPPFGYAENRPLYQGAYRFSKHYYHDVRDLKSAGEEFDCARAIDMHPAVDYWVRNVDRAEGSFWLPLHDGKFYPDFVVKLKDGRVLVVEYKGEHLKDSPDSLEKQNIGEFLARKSEGRCLFLMATERDAQDRDVSVQIDMICTAQNITRKPC
jgi:type III restriction enzyme